MYHWPNIPPPFTPRAMRFWACGPGGRRPALEIRRCGGCSRSRSLAPSAASEALRSCCALQVVFPSMLPRREQCSCALTPGVVPGRRGGPGKSGRKAIGRVSRYAQADVFPSYTA